MTVTINDGNTIALRGLGDAGINGGPAGDLIIEVFVKQSSIFTRRGNDVYCEVPITFAEAALGASVDIPTLEGSTKFSVPEGVQTGASFTLKGNGMPNVNTGRRGDLLFTVVIETPKGLTQKQKDLLRAFADSLGESNNSRKNSFFKKIFRS
ncbi:MAG: hypothetical protein MJ078_03530 [Clostridia bacterium]|nr:hypothetical protein [Clostridia bacterium]